jgi:hypothetical protein
MFRSGELSVGKILHWAANGIAPAEKATPASDPNFGIWTPDSAAAASTSLVPPESPTDFSFANLLGSILEVQTISETPPTSVDPNLPISNNGTAVEPTQPAVIPTTATGLGQPPKPSPQATNELRPLWIPVNDLREVIRFDVSPYWVQQRWQPATQLDLDQDGYYGFRVPLQTDQRVGQLNGALTFYFDGEATVQRIQFRGYAADTAALHNLLTQYFRFEGVPDREQLLAPIHQNVARGMFRYTDPVVEVPGQTTRVSEVAFEINSTQGKYQLSEAYRQLAVQ